MGIGVNTADDIPVRDEGEPFFDVERARVDFKPRVHIIEVV